MFRNNINQKTTFFNVNGYHINIISCQKHHTYDYEYVKCAHNLMYEFIYFSIIVSISEILLSILINHIPLMMYKCCSGILLYTIVIYTHAGLRITLIYLEIFMHNN